MDTTNMTATALLKRPGIGGRLLFWFLAVALLPLLVAGYSGVRRSASSLREEVTGSLTAVADTKVRELATYVRERKRNATTLAGNPMIIAAMSRFAATYDTGGVESPEYVALDEELRPYLTFYQEKNRYYDLFLVSPAGDVVFTVIKEDDLATNLTTGPYRDLGLGRSFQEAATLRVTEISDFRYYPPSDQPAAFIAAPVLESGRLIGVVALQMNVQEVYALAGNYTGLGDTGETMIASKEGDELVVVAPLRHDPQAAFRRRVRIGSQQSLPAQKSVQGERGSGISVDYRGEEVLALWRYIPEIRWGMVVKVDTSEAFGPSRRLQAWFLTIGFITTLGVAVAAALISRSISRPIRALHKGAEVIGSGNLEHRVGTDRSDEIGQLSRAFDQMVVDLGRATASRDELDREIAQRKRAVEATIRLQQERLETLVQLGQMAAAPTQVITDFGLEEAVRLTESQIGYLAFMNDDETILTMHSWSKTAMEQCAIIDKPIVYPVEKTGLWGEAVRQRKPIITNDYAAPSPLKKGHPEGHVPVKRHMNVPVFDGERIVAVAGVGNKVEEYDDSDVRQLTLLMQGMWRLIQHRRAEEALKKAHDELDRQAAVLEGMNDVFQEALTCDTDEQVAKTCLAVAKRLTGSKFGFIGEVNEQGRFDTIALSDPGWTACRIVETDAVMLIRDMEIRGIWGQVIEDERSLIVNDPTSHPSRVGVPEGHPPLTCFLGVPLRRGEETIGMISVANKSSGYDSEDQQALESLSVAFVEALMRKRAELALQKSHDELEIRVQERTAELRRSNAELAEFAYVASHDLQEPLRMVGSYMGLLERRYKDKLDSDACEFIEFAVDGAKRMQTLIEDLLAYSRVMTRGKAFEPVDSNAVVDEVIQNLQMTINEHGATVMRDVLPMVAADRTQLVQLIQNLVGNAIKFHGQERPRVQVSAQKVDKVWVFSVQDNGIGIAPKYEDRVFRIFQRLHTREEYQGTGIGLAVCKRIVDRHGGRIWLESEPGKGTTFCFTLSKKGVSA